MLISYKTRERLPDKMKKFFKEDNCGNEKYYVCRNFLAGAFELFKGMVEGFMPVFESN